MIFGNIEIDQDAVDDVGRRPWAGGEVNRADRPVETTIEADCLATNQRAIGGDGIDELVNRRAELRLNFIQNFKNRWCLIMFHEGIVFGRTVSAQSLEDLIMSIHRIYVQRDDFR